MDDSTTDSARVRREEGVAAPLFPRIAAAFAIVGILLSAMPRSAFPPAASWLLGALGLVLGERAGATIGRRETSVGLALGGLGVVLAASMAAASTVWAPSLMLAGSLVAVAGARIGVARLPRSSGLAGVRAKGPWPSIAGAAGLAAPVALLPLGSSAFRSGGRFGWVSDRSTVALTAVALATVLLLSVAQEASRRRRDPRAPEQMEAALAALVAPIVVAIAVAAALGGHAVLVLSVGVAAGAAALAISTRLAASDRTRTRLSDVTALGWRIGAVGTVAVGAAVLASFSNLSAPLWGVFASALAIVADRATSRAIELHRAEQTRIVRVARDARFRLHRGAGDDALCDALGVFSRAALPERTAPELYTQEPPTMITLDAAGYLREQKASVFDRVVSMAMEEPYGVLTRAALEPLRVRRAEVRAPLDWLADRNMDAAIVVQRDGVPRGLLLVAFGADFTGLGVYDLIALGELALELSTFADARARLWRAERRETEMQQLVRAADERALRAELDGARRAEHNRRLTSRLARPATVGGYAAQSRLALEALERRARSGAHAVVRSPSGVDPVPYVARAHLSGVRASGPFIVVDGTMAREHDVDRWSSPETSPLGLVHGGTLCLVDGAALPHDVQRLVARVMAERVAPWSAAEAVECSVVLTTARELTAAEGGSVLASELASRLGEALAAPIVLPSVRERAEDLRSILVDRVAREGLRVRGRPVGIDNAACALLIEYDFPGEEAELISIAKRLVQATERDVITADDVQALGLPAEAPLTSGKVDLDTA